MQHRETTANRFPIHPSDTLHSSNVESLFTNVLVKDTLTIMQNMFSKELSLLSSSKLFVNTIQSSYFQANKNFYYQTDCLATGTPLSPIIADIVLQNLVNQVITLTKFHAWYFDDIFTIWNGNLQQFLQLPSKINIHDKSCKKIAEPIY